MAYTSNDVKALRNKTGCSLASCKQAFDYAEAHEGCSPEGYLKAKYFAVKIEPFEKKVKAFSAMERNKYD